MSAGASGAQRRLHQLSDKLVPKRFRELEDDHPARVALRTYTLSLSLSLGPALIPILLEGNFKSKQRSRLVSVLKKELSASGFAFAMTLAAGGGASLEYCLKRLEANVRPKTRSESSVHKFSILSNVLLKSVQLGPVTRTFICHAIAALLGIILMHSRRRTQVRRVAIPLTAPISSSDGRSSPTLDLTLLLFVRALDTFAQCLFHQHAQKLAEGGTLKSNGEPSADKKRVLRKRVAMLTDKLDALLFWAASARIMWCFFYKPGSLPRSYVKWIRALANIDDRLALVLRKLREGTWAYGNEQSHTLLSTMAQDLGYPPSWGDSLVLPEYGGKAADEVWKSLGVKGRDGVGGIPCEVVHARVGSSVIPGGVGGSCGVNALVRGGTGFLEGLALYAPIHFLPVLLTRPRELLSPLLLKRLAFALLRSSLFLSVFISSIWTAVCFTRTWGIARLFPRISHNFIDGPFGCIMAGCLVCGGSIWIEQGKRRGEIALYVLPRAIRTLLSQSYLKSGARSLLAVERFVFALSLASILTASRHYPETLRGLSRWTAMFVTKGTPRSWYN